MGLGGELFTAVSLDLGAASGAASLGSGAVSLDSGDTSLDPGDDSCCGKGVLVWTGDGSNLGKCSGLLMAEDRLLPGVFMDEEEGD